MDHDIDKIEHFRYIDLNIEARRKYHREWAARNKEARHNSYILWRNKNPEHAAMLHRAANERWKLKRKKSETKD